MRAPHQRAQTICERLHELYGGRRPQQLRDTSSSYEDLLTHVTQLLWDDLSDIYPIQLLYTYFVMHGSEVMEPTLQDVGHTLMRNHGVSHEQAQQALNIVIRRLVALGRMRHRQRQRRHRKASYE